MSRNGINRSRLIAVGAVSGAVALAAAVVALSDGSDPLKETAGRSQANPAGAAQQASGGAGADADDSSESPDGDPDGGDAGVPSPAAEPDLAEAAALNDEGYALVQAGQAEQAVPVLRRAVSLSPEGTDDLTYAFALFNLGHALREAGRPDEAVPILRRRLEIPNQTPLVREELRAALAESASD